MLVSEHSLTKHEVYLENTRHGGHVFVVSPDATSVEPLSRLCRWNLRGLKRAAQAPLQCEDIRPSGHREGWAGAFKVSTRTLHTRVTWRQSSPLSKNAFKTQKMSSLQCSLSDGEREKTAHENVWTWLVLPGTYVQCLFCGSLRFTISE